QWYWHRAPARSRLFTRNDTGPGTGPGTAAAASRGASVAGWAHGGLRRENPNIRPLPARPAAEGDENGSDRYPMAKKDGDLTAAIVGGVAALAAGYVARKALTFAWTQTTGKEPPTDPESLEVGLGEALG